MTMRRPRLTVRRLMIVIALAGVALGGSGLYRRHEYARARAEHHELLAERVLRSSLNEWDSIEALRVRDYHARMGGKWRGAAARPWMSFEDDPPAPDWSALLEQAL